MITVGGVRCMDVPDASKNSVWVYEVECCLLLTSVAIAMIIGGGEGQDKFSSEMTKSNQK